MRKLVREPLVHFLLIGAGLFFLFGWKTGPAPAPGGQSAAVSTNVAVTQDDIDQMVATFTKTWQRPPGKEEVKNLVEDLVRDEIYYREALSIGLDRDDSVIRRRMRQKMEFILEDITAQAGPTEEELLFYLQRHSNAYLTDPQMAFRQVYISASRRGPSAEADARQALSLLREGADPVSVGDPIALELEIPLSTISDVGHRFGDDFVRHLVEIESGKWEGPIRSGFGLHLVFVTERVGSKLPELKDVMEIVKRDWMIERQKELKNAAYAKIRERYTVTVETRPVPIASAASTNGALQ